MSRNLYIVSAVFVFGAFVGIGVWAHTLNNELQTMAQETAQEWAMNPMTHIKALIEGADKVNREFEGVVNRKAQEMIMSEKTIERLVISTIACGFLAIIGLVLADMMVIMPLVDMAKRTAQSARTKIQQARFNRAKRALEKNLAQIETLRNNQQ